MEYLNFYRLKQDPFGITPDPDFFYPSKWHTEALQTMEYLVRKGEGFMLLTGGPGTGKTTLIRTFLKSTGNKISPIVIYHSTLSPEEFLRYITKKIQGSNELEDSESLSRLDKYELIKRLTEKFSLRRQKGLRNLIIIDEAQDLPQETLTEIKQLSNIETEKEKLVHFILLAQPHFEEIISKPSYAQLSQRISLRARIYALDKDEVESYIKFRLQCAGEVPIHFEKSAVKLIYKASKGIPRLINLICSSAIMAGYLDSSFTIKKSHVKASIKHLKLD